eukprot:TRINITY_DN34740_c0_g1_i1.p1 TRINITY_DN34740_c0_g1~~TRINITY_DN34740_c0_g1_i1.p1  ORF type:complete len:477 (-),score=66.14 TRINITY_DN34740_c0_g1_i1:87-1517(-)
MHYPVAGSTDETMSPDQTVAMFHLLYNEAKCHLQQEEDGSLIFSVPKRNEQVLMLVCSFPLQFIPRDEATAINYPESRRRFYVQNTMDSYQDKSEKHDLSCRHLDKVLVLLNSSGEHIKRRPWWLNHYWFLLSTFCGCSAFYRWYFYKRTQKVVWTVTKHFSMLEPSTWVGDPIKSLKHSSDPKIAKVFQAGSRLKLERGNGASSDEESDWEADSTQTFVPDVHTDVRTCPEYWTNQDMSIPFDTKERLDPATEQMLQTVLDETFIAKATRDRKGEVPDRLALVSAHRIEDRDLWCRYVQKRRYLVSRGAFTALEDMPGSGTAKTMRALGKTYAKRLAVDTNELYLFHGSTPSGALGIGEDGFRLDLAGSHAGTMFGKGAYFAECSSKSDEYASADPSGLFAGRYALLLCRVVCGEFFYQTKSDIPAVEKALKSQEYDGVLGDREAAVGTYREFVVFDQEQVYPEYVLIYKRERKK